MCSKHLEVPLPSIYSETNATATSSNETPFRSSPVGASLQRCPVGARAEAKISKLKTEKAKKEQEAEGTSKAKIKVGV